MPIKKIKPKEQLLNKIETLFFMLVLILLLIVQVLVLYRQWAVF